MKDEIKFMLEQVLPLVDLDSDFLIGELDSLGVTTILMVLSEHYAIHLDSSDVTPRNFKSLESLAVMVQRKQSNKNS